MHQLHNDLETDEIWETIKPLRQGSWEGVLMLPEPHSCDSRSRPEAVLLALSYTCKPVLPNFRSLLSRLEKLERMAPPTAIRTTERGVCAILHPWDIRKFWVLSTDQKIVIRIPHFISDCLVCKSLYAYLEILLLTQIKKSMSIKRSSRLERSPCNATSKSKKQSQL